MGNDLYEAEVAAHIRSHGVIECPTVYVARTTHGRPISKAHRETLRAHEATRKEKRGGTSERKIRQAREYAEQKVFPVIRPLAEKGITDSAVFAAALTTAGIATPTGEQWTAKRLRNYLTSHPL